MAKKYICKHCKVQVVAPGIPDAVLGKEHKKCCPRSRPTTPFYAKVK